jgi:hypothetical protein
MRRSAIVGLVAAAALGAAAVAAAQELRWELGFKHEKPDWVKVAAADGTSSIGWFMTYEVENKTGAARKPTLRILLRTDTKKEIADGGDARTLLAAKKRLGLEKVTTAVDLRSGIDDGAKVSCVAAFGEVDKYAKDIELRVYGLMDPVTRVKGKEVYEVKYWSVKYNRKGDEFNRTEDPWTVVSSGWVTEEAKAEK